MPIATVKSGSDFQLAFISPQDFMAFINGQMAPAASQFGLRLYLEPRPKEEVDANRI